MYTVMVDSGHKEGFPCGFCRGYGAASREVWVSSLGQMAIAFLIPLFLQCGGPGLHTPGTVKPVNPNLV